jgi:FAD synthetase
MDPLDKAILVSIYSSGFDSGITSYDYFKSRTVVPEDLFNSRLKKLNKLGFVDLTNPVSLSFFGRGSIKVVLVGGVFDILHPGHIQTLKAAKSYGDVLVAVIARTSTARKINSSRVIYHDEVLRKELVSSIKFVDVALIGFESSLYRTVEYVKPDIIALGYDQAHGEKEIAMNCRKRGIDVQVIRLNTPIPKIKSTSIKEELGTSIYDI